MKTIEQKAKAYDEAIERAKKINREHSKKGFKPSDDVMYIFPKLKENGDEEIRKAVIYGMHALKGQHKTCFASIPIDNVIAWLEKQGKKVEPIEGFNSEFERQISQLIASIINNEHEYTEAFIKWTSDALLNYAKYEIDKQGEQKNIEGTFINVDEVRENFVNKIYRILANDTTNDRANDIIYYFDSLPTIYSHTNKSLPPDDLIEESYQQQADDLIDMVSEKSALSEKVEPKFNVGDWVTDDNGETVFHITIDKNMYQLETIGGFSCHFSYESVEERYRLWTIQDAKDGDVLYENDTNSVLLFKSQTCGWIKVYCDFWINKNKFTGNDPADYGRVSEMNLKPATKEQRDLLFQKMKEAGYEWDAEKKELKKIEQNPAWSEEDEKMANDLIEGFQSPVKAYYLVHTSKEIVGWLKSIKDRVQPVLVNRTITLK